MPTSSVRRVVIAIGIGIAALLAGVALVAPSSASDCGNVTVASGGQAAIGITVDRMSCRPARTVVGQYLRTGAVRGWTLRPLRAPSGRTRVLLINGDRRVSFWPPA